MGPHSFERGNSRSDTSPNARDSLQWGLTLSSEETVLPFVWQAFRLGASMGPHSFERGNHKFILPFAFGELASMGPHSFERGNWYERQARKARKPLQWGLTLSSEETYEKPTFKPSMGTLQWGLTLSSEETAAVGSLPAGIALLQWGLTLSSEETAW